MMEFFITPLGLGRMYADLAAIDRGARDGKDVLHELAPAIQARARELAPVSTGKKKPGEKHLNETIFCEQTSDGIVLYATAPYAYWVEYGHTNHWTGKWVEGKFYMSQTVAEFTSGYGGKGDTGIVGEKIIDNIEKKRRMASIASAGAAISLGQMALGAIFGAISFGIIGFSGLLSMSR